MSNFWKKQTLGEKVICMSIVPNVMFTEDSYEEYENMYRSMYDEKKEFLLVMDARNMESENVPSWFWPQQYTLTTSQRIKKQQIIGVCVMIGSKGIATLIQGFLKIYDTDRPTLVTADNDEASNWIINLLDLSAKSESESESKLNSKPTESKE